MGMDKALQNFLVRYEELVKGLVLKWIGKLKVKKTNLNFSKNESDFNRASVMLENQSLDKQIIKA